MDAITATAWHRECVECGIVLTVKIENPETGILISRPAPEDKACGLCKTEFAGPWVEGEYDDDEA